MAEKQNGPTRKLITIAVVCFVILLALLAVRPSRLSSVQEPDTRKPTGDPKSQVWVDQRAGVYYCSKSLNFGRILPGEQMAQLQAQQRHFRPAYGSVCK
jgi:hypothetical protein